MQTSTTNIVLVILVVGLIGWTLVKPDNKPAPETQTSQTQQTDYYNTDTQKESPMPVSSSTNKKEYKSAGQVIKAGKSYTAVIKTSAGDITVELSKDTPVTTNSFVFLSQEKFYDGVIFHRVIPGFMIQGGDPTGTGMGGPGYKFADEKFAGEYKRGTIAMANSGPNTNGSQFFIMHADYPLPPNYVIFGKTVQGLEVVDKISAGKTGPNDRPVEPVTITSIEITEK
jgi:cyclophilin family peptidyl-prolyl cis-trans isomerase